MLRSSLLYTATLACIDLMICASSSGWGAPNTFWVNSCAAKVVLTPFQIVRTTFCLSIGASANVKVIGKEGVFGGRLAIIPFATPARRRTRVASCIVKLKIIQDVKRDGPCVGGGVWQFFAGKQHKHIKRNGRGRRRSDMFLNAFQLPYGTLLAHSNHQRPRKLTTSFVGLWNLIL